MKTDRKPPLNFMAIFGLFMVVLYIGLGIYVIWSDYFYYIALNIRIVFGLFLIVYGLFRFVRVYFKLKNPER